MKLGWGGFFMLECIFLTIPIMLMGIHYRLQIPKVSNCSNIFFGVSVISLFVGAALAILFEKDG